MSNRACLFVIAALVPALSQTTSAADRPNVLFIILDDMNDWLGCYGGHPDAKTPNIDSLAKRGVLFTNAHCVSPICGPSRAAVLTGMRPETTGVYHNKGTYVDYVPRAVTFPEHFRTNGYLALAAGKVNHGLGEPDPRLWDENGPDCGVLGTPFIGDELDTVKMNPKRIIARGPLKITLPANGGLSAMDRPNNTWDSFDWAPLDCPETDFPDRKIADWGAKQLGRKHDKPLLVALGFYKPHQPFFVPRKYFNLHDRETTSLPPTIAGDLYDVPPPGRELATRPWTSGTHKTVAAHGAWRDAVRAYLATVSFVDALVGRVIDALDRSPYADNTWIILSSDHGWSLGEKEHWGKHVPWRESVRMPLMVVPPKSGSTKGFTTGARCDACVSLLDLYPTLIEACSLPVPPGLAMPDVDTVGLEGKSLLPLIADPDAEWQAAAVSTVGRGTHSVSTDRWRYIRYFDGSEELYDLRSDPREWFNLANKPEHAQLKQQLARHIPEDKRLKQFVRWGRWKCVFPVRGQPMLFDYHGEFGISEQNDLAAEHPEVIAEIREYLGENQIMARRVNMPELDDTGRLRTGK
jgi:arylsulfatase A-like enzyme